MALADFLGKKYKMVESENFDEFMEALGVGWITRKAANAVTPSVELTEKDGSYLLKTSSTFKTTEMWFKPGEPFDEERADGMKVRSTVTIDGAKMIQEQEATTDDKKKVTYIREFGPTEMKAIMTVDDIICTRYYHLQE